MNFPVQAITLDLDDTLWPFAPIGARIDQVLYEWMLQHSPATAAMYPVAAMRELRERSFHDNPHLHYDLSALRRLTLSEALEKSGADPALLEPAYEAFYAARNQVEFYPDAMEALALAAAASERVAAAVDAGMTVAVIGRALLIVRQDRVGLGNFLELGEGLFRTAVAVGMVNHGQLAIGRLQARRVDRALDPQDFVIVTLRHQAFVLLLFSASAVRVEPRIVRSRMTQRPCLLTWAPGRMMQVL